MKNLILDSSDCSFLVSFSDHPSVSSLATALKMDKSQISRRMSKIAAMAPVLIRVQGRWVLTPEGKRLTLWFREMVDSQVAILSAKDELVLGTSQTMSERRLTALMDRLMEETQYKRVKVVSNVNQIENNLISGEVDFALVCARPQSPEIRYKKIFKSPFLIFLPAEWAEHGLNLQTLLEKPYIAHSGIDLRSVLGLERAIPAPLVVFDHLAGVRQAVVEGLGWAVLPAYSCLLELRQKKIKVMKNHPVIDFAEEYQLCWVNGRFEKKIISRLIALLNDEFSKDIRTTSN